MAAVAATAYVATGATCFVPKGLVIKQSAIKPVSGLPASRMPRLVCSAEKNDKREELQGLPTLAAALTTAGAFAVAHPAFALVDERLSTEGTGLGLGLSNPQLGWILVGVTALIWSLYFVYSATLPEGDDDSGLSL